jgi:hypothetical protein
MGTYRFSALTLRAQENLIGGADSIRIVLTTASDEVAAQISPIERMRSASRLGAANHKIDPTLELVVDSRAELREAAALVDRVKG